MNSPAKTGRALVILSGGQDSATCLLLAREQYEHVYTVSFDYGQRHRIELEQSLKIAQMLNVAGHYELNVVGLLNSTSPLTDPKAELETYKDFASMDKTIGDRIEKTFVPLRNLFFIVTAANLALALGAYDVITGVCASDNANYPDCTEDFIDSTESTMREALGMHRESYDGPMLNLRAPLLANTKDQIVNIGWLTAGDELWKKVMEQTHTCYAGKYPPCGECHSCVLRAEGFRQAGVADPLVQSGASRP